VKALFLLTEAERESHSEQLASLRPVAIMSGRVAVMTKESLGRIGEWQGAQKQLCTAGSGEGPFRTLD